MSRGLTIEEMQKKIYDFCESNCDECKLYDLACSGYCMSDTDKDRLQERCDLIDSESLEPAEKVDHPEHYKAGEYECIDVMIAVFGVNAVRIFCLLNAFKYMFRCNKKNGVEDINKATWYLKKHAELCEVGEHGDC